VAAELHVFFWLGLVDRLRGLFLHDRMDAPLRRQLASAIEIHLARPSGGETGRPPGPEETVLREWLQELSPPGLADRVRDLTAREFWSPGRHEVREAAFGHHADELLASPGTLGTLTDWFDSGEARSGRNLGFIVGRRDEHAALARIVEEWMRAGRCLDFTTNYLGGIFAREGRLPDSWANLVDAVAAERPEDAAWMTAAADISGRGFERLVQLLPRLSAPASRFLRSLAYGDWLRILQTEQRARALDQLDRLAEAGDAGAPGVGLELLRMWGHIDGNALDTALVEGAIRLVRRVREDGGAVDRYVWREVLGLLCPHALRLVAELSLTPL
jgi:hypothetical protein